MSFKAIKLAASSHFCHGVQLEILPTLLGVFLRHLFCCCRSAFDDDGDDKINELFNFKCNLVSRFNKLRDTTIELGLKENILKTWNSALNKNGNLDIQFN